MLLGEMLTCTIHEICIYSSLQLFIKLFNLKKHSFYQVILQWPVDFFAILLFLIFTKYKSTKSLPKSNYWFISKAVVTLYLIKSRVLRNKMGKIHITNVSLNCPNKNVIVYMLLLFIMANSVIRISFSQGEQIRSLCFTI